MIYRANAQQCWETTSRHKSGEKRRTTDNINPPNRQNAQHFGINASVAVLWQPCTPRQLGGGSSPSPWPGSRLKPWGPHAALWDQGMHPAQGPKPCAAQGRGNRPGLVPGAGGTRIGVLENMDGERGCGRGTGVLEMQGQAGQICPFQTPLPTPSPPWSAALPCWTR